MQIYWLRKECIPVGWCLLPGGVVPEPGGCLLLGGCLLRGVCSQGGLPTRGVSAPGGLLPARGGSPCPETPPVNRITHTCKNITLATTSLRPVKNKCTFCQRYSTTQPRANVNIYGIPACLLDCIHAKRRTAQLSGHVLTECPFVCALYVY